MKRKQGSERQLNTTSKYQNFLFQDLEDTIQIVEKNPSKFRIDSQELNNRKVFIQQTRDEVNEMKTKAQNYAASNAAINAKFSDVSFLVGFY